MYARFADEILIVRNKFVHHTMQSFDIDNEINRFERDELMNAPEIEPNEEEEDNNVLPVLPPPDPTNPVNPTPNDIAVPAGRATIERFVAPDQYSDEEYSRLMGYSFCLFN